jgi:hypothetical protein
MGGLFKQHGGSIEIKNNLAPQKRMTVSITLPFELQAKQLDEDTMVIKENGRYRPRPYETILNVNLRQLQSHS